MEPQAQAARTWTLPETRLLLDLIRDMGFTQALTRNSYRNWHVFERLCMLLGRCNTHVSPWEVKSHWQALKMKFFHLKSLRDAGAPPAVAADFPFYEEMDQFLTPHSKTGSCKWEADSSGQCVMCPGQRAAWRVLVGALIYLSLFFLVSGLEGQSFQSSSVYEGQAASSGNQNADRRPYRAMEASPGDVPGDQSGPDIQRLVILLYRTARQLMDMMERLSEVERQLSIQHSYICSAALQMAHQLYNASSEQHFSWNPAHNQGMPSSPTLHSRVLR
ncbi:hypothetical protein GDO78_021706 [Eleutherodactylus coqui]|uniref:Myb/SANT-like DNA-binding domain-containing protein n=1 Tax=Eleutherodactylus coqui TaxID=57060 RepID=A0A8J6BN59_ELECQ|nr:hypothetical protein GDO78_021706 [Eleutherodactylus coqui]